MCVYMYIWALKFEPNKFTRREKLGPDDLNSYPSLLETMIAIYGPKLDSVFFVLLFYYIVMPNR